MAVGPAFFDWSTRPLHETARKMATVAGTKLMNDRFLSWLDLVPPEASISVQGAPQSLIDLLGARVDETGDIWLSWDVTPDDLPVLSHFHALVLVKPKNISAAWLRAQGFTETLSFTIVPNINDPRWFIPLAPRSAAVRAWDLFNPFRKQARLSKVVAKLLTRGLGAAHIGDSIILARRQVSALEEVVIQAVGTREIAIAIASGTPGPYRKLTLQLTTAEGVVLAYCKYGRHPKSGSVVRREAEFLDYVRKLGLQSALVPATLYHGAHNNGYLLLSTPLKQHMSLSEIRLTQRHAEVLDELSRHTAVRLAGDLLRELSDRAALLSDTVDASWRERFSCAAAVLAETPGLRSLPTALSHGDFTPWNIRVDRRANRLAIFDWEDARIDRFLLWDTFHFQTQIAILVQRWAASVSVQAALNTARHAPTVQRLQLSTAQVYALFVAYLTDVSLRHFEDRAVTVEGAATRDASQELRGQMLDITVNMLATLSTAIDQEAWHSKSSTAS